MCIFVNFPVDFATVDSVRFCYVECAFPMP